MVAGVSVSAPVSLWAGFARGVLVEAPRQAGDIRRTGVERGSIVWFPVAIRRGWIEKLGPSVAISTGS